VRRGGRWPPDRSGTGREARRFPFEQVPKVERELHQLSEEIGISILVTSAACGANLVALKVAGAMNIPARIILPFSAARFKETSVLDRPRPGYWGELFGNAIAAARASGGVVELSGDPRSHGAYSAMFKAGADAAESALLCNLHRCCRGKRS
jgi:hypothetical protein